MNKDFWGEYWRKFWELGEKIAAMRPKNPKLRNSAGQRIFKVDNGEKTIEIPRKTRTQSMQDYEKCMGIQLKQYEVQTLVHQRKSGGDELDFYIGFPNDTFLNRGLPNYNCVLIAYNKRKSTNKSPGESDCESVGNSDAAGPSSGGSHQLESQQLDVDERNVSTRILMETPEQCKMSPGSQSTTVEGQSEVPQDNKHIEASKESTMSQIIISDCVVIEVSESDEVRSRCQMMYLVTTFRVLHTSLKNIFIAFYKRWTTAAESDEINDGNIV